MTFRLRTFALISIGLSAAPLPAHADEVPAAVPAAMIAVAPPDVLEGSVLDPAVGQAAAPSQPATKDATALSDADLGGFRGGAGLVVGDQSLTAVSSGNSSIGSYSAGAVSFTDAAFSNFSGLGNITVNTGALSQLQSAMNITVNVNP